MGGRMIWTPATPGRDDGRPARAAESVPTDALDLSRVPLDRVGQLPDGVLGDWLRRVLADEVASPEPPAAFDSATAEPAAGPVTRSAFGQFVVKLHSRCNLACDHCYVYESGDEGWRTRPRAMSVSTLNHVAARIAEHARTHALPEVVVILHGGEPLLSGRDRVAHLLDGIERDLAGTAVALRATVQTNGTLLDAAWLELFARHDVKVGISVDGSRRAHDRHRRFHDGRGSHDAVTRSLDLLRAEHPALFGGLLCTVDLENDPVDTYETLLGYEPPMMNFALPHATWDKPPPVGPAGRHSGAPYGEWLCAAFDRWYDAPRRETRVRLFDAAVALALGGTGHSEVLGNGVPSAVVVETDGDIECTDALKASFPGAAATGLNVARDSFDDAARQPEVQAARGGVDALCRTCRACPVVDMCGGGLYAHRHRRGTGFLNPSVYCRDLERFVSHVRSRVVSDVLTPARVEPA